MFYNCPFCGNNLNMDEGGICSNCNNELVVINNKIYIKNLYESLYAMNDSINTTMEDAQTTKEEMDTNFGLPSQEDSSAGTFQCTYAFTDDFSLIEKAEYETYVATGASYGIYSGFALFNAGKLVAFSIGQNE